jgi:peptidoglycan-N-acetylglucosamine deacetylase
VPGRESAVSGSQRSDSALTQGLRGLGTAALALPAVPTVAADRSPASVVLAAVAVVAGGVMAGWISRRMQQPAPLFAALGALLVFTAGWLLPQAEVAPTTVLLGLGVGAGVGLGGGGLDSLRSRDGAVGVATGLVALTVLVAVDGVHGTVWAGLMDGVAIALVGLLTRARPRTRTPGGVRAAAIAATALTAGAVFWVGANSHTASWFGSQVAHGPRDGRAVAITFDDGPDDPYTLEIARILDRRGAKGTFFMVGKALDRRPDIARTLREEGHLLGNHSYHHDSWRWLDPRYPELERTQRAFRRHLGVCPTFYRAPHGQHTPFLAHVVGDHGMTMVGWDVSAGDWKTRDARLVARRVLDDVQPGSIIVLHDGLDGNVTANRSVLVRAMPLILDGLERRALEPVRLDRLLDERGYGDHC